MSGCVDFRIIDHNYLFKTNVDIYPSSYNVEFPATNLRKYFRSKTWRTSGHFEITASNNKIDFKISGGGAEKTATLTAGHYSIQALEAHIKAKLDAADGVNTYQVDFLSSGLWYIKTSGAFLSLLFGTGSNLAASAGATLGFAVDDYVGDIEYYGANIACHTDEWLLIDLQTPEEIDSFAVVFDPVLENTLSGEILLKLQASATDHWAAPPVDVSLTFNETNEVITYFFETVQEYRYWRFWFSDPRNPNLYLEIPKIILGKKIAELGSPDIGFSVGFDDQSKKIQTQFGHEYVDVLPIKKLLKFDFSVMDKDKIEELWKSYFRVGTVKPVFVVIDSQEVLFSKDRFSIYGKFVEKSEVSQAFYRYFKTGLIIEEAF